MIVQKTACLDLAAIADSGQCFRWKREGEGYRVIALGKVLHAWQKPGKDALYLDCSQQDFDSVWKNYLDLDTDYPSIIAAVPPEDVYLRAAAEYGQGIRILRQEPWETLITFILSQRKNIPAIKQAVEKLCAAAGQVIGEENGEPLFAFPTPSEILGIGLERLQSCGLGYRAPYIYQTAEAFFQGTFCIHDLEALDDEALFEALCSLYGVGRKIAHCAMLFGFHRMNAFPVDVWMDRVWKNRYPDGIPIARYAPWAGVMQQYMFAYERYLAGRGTWKQTV
ncbi:MAG: DNA-3-methyladenine glycosylase 2 family protein [Clostridia bacterium]|nr:DNA-3-methyladenine glycosylase 2 family protein [Clostridia bacterium]